MAKQESIIQIKGTIGELNFYRQNGEYRVRKKTSLTKERICTAPEFERTRENMNQFGLVASQLKLFMDAIVPIKNTVGLKLRSNLLTGLFFKLAKLDPDSARGEKQVSIGISKEQGIGLFRGLSLTPQTLRQQLGVALVVDRATGAVSSEEFIPMTQLIYPPSATHFEMQVAVVAVNFGAKTHAIRFSQSLVAVLDKTPQQLDLIPEELPDLGQGTSVFVVFWLKCYQENNGSLYALKSAASLSVDVVDAFNV